MKIESSQKMALKICFAALWLTGAGWLAVHYFGSTKPGSSALSAKHLMMCAHGAFGFGALFLLGTLLDHFDSGLSGYTNKKSGIALVLIAAIFTATAWLLYYASGESTRAAASTVHWVLGLLSPLLLIVHLRGR